MAKSDGSDYFERIGLLWIVSLTLSLGYFTCIVFAPEIIPFQQLGPIGTFGRYLMDNHADILYKGWWVTVVAHVFEDLVALKLCSDKGVSSTGARFLWLVQTTLYGFPSLRLLLKYDPKHPKRH